MKGSLQSRVNWTWLNRGQRVTLVDYQDTKLVQDARNNRRVEFLCALNGIEMRAYDESII